MHVCVDSAWRSAFFILSRHAQRTGIPSFLCPSISGRDLFLVSGTFMFITPPGSKTRRKRETGPIQQFTRHKPVLRTEVTPIFTVFNRHPGTSVICIEETDIQPLSKLWYWRIRRPSVWYLLHREKKGKEKEEELLGKGEGSWSQITTAKKRGPLPMSFL